MKSRSKFYLYVCLAAGVAALVIYLLVGGQPDPKKPAEASLRPAATKSPKSESVDRSAPAPLAEKTSQGPSVPSSGAPSPAVAQPPQTSSPMQTAANEEKPATENTLNTRAPAGWSTSLPQESIATRRMYMAHASLRTPEVANPDSETNRQILQTMVTKALSRVPNPAQSSSLSK